MVCLGEADGREASVLLQDRPFGLFTARPHNGPIATRVLDEEPCTLLLVDDQLRIPCRPHIDHTSGEQKAGIRQASGRLTPGEQKAGSLQPIDSSGLV